MYDDNTTTGYYPGPTPGENTPPPTQTIPDNASPYGQDVLERASAAGVPPEVIVAQDQQQQDPTANIEVNVGTFDPTAPRPGEESGFSPIGGSSPVVTTRPQEQRTHNQPPTQQPLRNNRLRSNRLRNRQGFTHHQPDNHHLITECQGRIEAMRQVVFYAAEAEGLHPFSIINLDATLILVE